MSRGLKEPSWVRHESPLRIFVSYERDILYSTRWNCVVDRFSFIQFLKEDRKITIETMAFDLDHPQNSGGLHIIGCPFPFTKTFILVLPTDNGSEGRWKEKKLIPSQHTTPKSNMKQVELNILQDWERLIYDSRTPGHLESFKTLETELRAFWERRKIMMRYPDWEMPSIEVMELVDCLPIVPL
jgi:hypothetical protein